MRAEWEQSPRQGLTWLTAADGGRWDITEEPIRQRRQAEGWAKRNNLGELARRAKNAADAASLERIAAEAEGESDTAPAGPGGGEAGPDLGGVTVKKNPTLEVPQRPSTGDPQADAEQAAVDLRTALIDRHRREWNMVRRMFYRAAQQAELAAGFDAAKFAKISSEILANIQEGERRTWGLDADLLDFDGLTDAQLVRVANGLPLR